MKPPDGKPPANEVGQTRSWLAKNKVPPAVANELIKTTRTRRENSDLYQAYCKEL